MNIDPMPPAADGLTVITSHVNADFDAMASMLAAQKLYPDALVVFPGSQEKTLRNFFVSAMVYLFNMVDLRDLDLAAVKRLVLVDTRQAGRIGKLAALLDKPDVEVHVYDHHPPRPDDIVSHAGEHRLVGATVTLLTGILRRRHIPITADEATVMCLGIYEDTGAFTFTSTTEEDFHAAAYLLGRGANLNTVAQLIAREISPEQVGLLNDMIQSLQRSRKNGKWLKQKNGNILEFSASALQLSLANARTVQWAAERYREKLKRYPIGMTRSFKCFFPGGDPAKGIAGRPLPNPYETKTIASFPLTGKLKSLSAARQAKPTGLYRGAIEYSCLDKGKNYAIRIGGKNNYALSGIRGKNSTLVLARDGDGSGHELQF